MLLQSMTYVMAIFKRYADAVVTVALYIFLALLGLLVLFQLALAFGAPWGSFAWGGQHSGGLPAGYRVGSLLSVFIYGFIALIALDKFGMLSLFPDGFAKIAMWAVFGYLTLGVLMNAVSRSRAERLTMTPVAAALAVLALLIAL